jgi:hypothetical protein
MSSYAYDLAALMKQVRAKKRTMNSFINEKYPQSICLQMSRLSSVSIHIQEDQGSNLGSKNGNPDIEVFRGFPQSLQRMPRLYI